MLPTCRADRITEASPDAAAPSRAACVHLSAGTRDRRPRLRTSPPDRCPTLDLRETTPSRIVRPDDGGRCDIVSAPRTNGRPERPRTSSRRSSRWHTQPKTAQTKSRSGTNEPSRPPAERPQAPARQRARGHSPRPRRAALGSDRPSPREHVRTRDPGHQKECETNPSVPPNRQQEDDRTNLSAPLTATAENCKANPRPIHLPALAALGLSARLGPWSTVRQSAPRSLPHRPRRPSGDRHPAQGQVDPAAARERE